MCFFFFLLPLPPSPSFNLFCWREEGGRVGERKQNGLWKVHMAGEKRIREREGEGNNRRFWRQSKWFREKISPHVKLGNISWGMPALNFLASNRTRDYSRTLDVVSFFFLNEHERGEARIPIRFRALIYHRPVAVFTEIGGNGYWQTSILFISL